MSQAKRIRIFWSPLGQRFYASNRYKILKQKDGKEIVHITGQKFDVTDEIASAVIANQIQFTRSRQAAPPAQKNEKEIADDRR
ncbi:MAG TPA: hypothetical protein VFW94_23430 [Candidatus Acidoferrales bacterium]|nr:hypothetical protein [Candidatus Acidoferrales bacterium]